MLRVSRAQGSRTPFLATRLWGMHARVEACEPSAWQDSRLVQTYSPRAAVHVLPAGDFGVFTVGRLPRDSQARQVLEDLAEEVCRALHWPRQISCQSSGRTPRNERLNSLPSCPCRCASCAT